MPENQDTLTFCLRLRHSPHDVVDRSVFLRGGGNDWSDACPWVCIVIWVLGMVGFGGCCARLRRS